MVFGRKKTVVLGLGVVVTGGIVLGVAGKRTDDDASDCPIFVHTKAQVQRVQRNDGHGGEPAYYSLALRLDYAYPTPDGKQVLTYHEDVPLVTMADGTTTKEPKAGDTVDVVYRRTAHHSLGLPPVRKPATVPKGCPRCNPTAVSAGTALIVLNGLAGRSLGGLARRQAASGYSPAGSFA